MAIVQETGPGTGERPHLVHWAAVLSGAAVGFAVFFIVSALWFALAGSSGTNFFAKNLAWFLLGDALFAALVAGFVGGYIGGFRQASSGLLIGLSIWGLLMFIALVLRTPQLNLVYQASTRAQGQAANFLSSSTLWATFGAFIGGFVLAGWAGVAGSAAAGPTPPPWTTRWLRVGGPGAPASAATRPQQSQATEPPPETGPRPT